MQIGNLRIEPILDGRSSVAPESLYQAAAKYFPPLEGSHGLVSDDWLPYACYHDGGKLDLSYGGFLVSDGSDRKVLVDLGQGPIPWVPEPVFAPTFSGRFLDSLLAMGVSPVDITDVVLTHLHFDHLGWASVDGVPTFPNATYRCHAADLAHFLPGDQMVTGVLTPVLSRLETWDADETLFPGFDVRPVPGHTPGSSLVVLSSGSQRLLLVGDILHSPADLLDEHWAGLADMDATLAHQARIALGQELERDETLFAPAHFPGLSFGRLLSRSDGGRDFSYVN
jgi:glyoxylase-like metal-dependent hydrolase (beta-lactamase superfamily II)